jgi:hypothetical protein
VRPQQRERLVCGCAGLCVLRPPRSGGTRGAAGCGGLQRRRSRCQPPCRRRCCRLYTMMHKTCCETAILVASQERRGSIMSWPVAHKAARHRHELGICHGHVCACLGLQSMHVWHVLCLLPAPAQGRHPQTGHRVRRCQDHTAPAPGIEQRGLFRPRQHAQNKVENMPVCNAPAFLGSSSALCCAAASTLSQQGQPRRYGPPTFASLQLLPRVNTGGDEQQGHLEQRRQLGDANRGEASALGWQVRPLAHLPHRTRQPRCQLLRRRQALQRPSPLKC